MTPYNYPAPLRDIERAINHWAQLKAETDAACWRDAIPAHWTRNFNNKAHSYIKGIDAFAIDDMVDRFTAQAKQALAGD